MLGKKNPLANLLAIAILAIAGFLFYRYYYLNSGTATLSWNANTEGNFAGYRLYYGAAPRNNDCPPGNYPNKIEVGKDNSYVLKNLARNKTYYFSVTTYNTSQKESCFSEEMHKDL